MTERAELVALDPLEMLLDAARYAEGNGGKYRNLEWAKAARAAVAKARLAAPQAAGWDEATLARAICRSDKTPGSPSCVMDDHPERDPCNFSNCLRFEQARGILEALRHNAPPDSGTGKSDDLGGRAVIEGDSVVIRFPLDAMQTAMDGAWNLHAFDTRYKISDMNEFSKEFVHALNREDERGTTNVHRLVDKAFIDCIESGAFGIEEHEQQDI